MKNLALLLFFIPVELFALSCAEYKGKVIEFEKHEKGHGIAHYFSVPIILEGSELKSITLHASPTHAAIDHDLEELVVPLSYKIDSNIARGWFYIPKGWLQAEIYVSYRHSDCGPIVVESINI